MRRRSAWWLIPVLLVVVALTVPSPASAAVSVSGWIDTAIFYWDKVAAGQQGLAVPLNTVPLKTNKEADHSQIFIDARASRLRVTWTDDVAGIKMSGSVEGDFFSLDGSALTSNSRHIRLRHAFARADHPSGFFLLAGQYWGLFSDVITAGTIPVIGFPRPIVSYDGPASSMGFLRQPQLRVGWRSPLGGGMGDLLLEADVEKNSVGGLNPAAPDLGAASVSEFQGEGQTTPLLTGKVSWLHPSFTAEAAGAFGNNTVTFTGGHQESKGAWGFQGTARATFAPVTVIGHYLIQKGLGRLLGTIGDFPTAAVKVADPTKFDNIESHGFYVGASLALSPQTAITGAYGWQKADENASIGFTGGQLKQHQTIHLNIWQKFWERWQAGIEYRWFGVKTFGGAKGDVTCVCSSLLYFF